MKSRRFLAILLSGSLLWTSGDFAHAIHAASEFNLNPPASLGHLTDSFRLAAPKASQPLVILIQDLHARYAVQKNIAGLLEFLSQKLGATSNERRAMSEDQVKKNSSLIAHRSSLPFAVAVEGASGPLDFSLMALFPDKKIKQGAADYLMKEGELTGAEYFAVMRGIPDLLTGVEDSEYYTLHRDLFRNTVENRTRLVEMLRGIQADLRKLRAIVYSKPLRKFQSKQDAFEAGRLDVEDYMSYLASESKALGMDVQLPDFYQDKEVERAWQQAEALAFMVKMQKARKPQEKDLVQVDHDLGLLLKVADLQASEQEVRSFAPRLNPFIALCRSLLKTSGNPTFDEASIRDLISSSIDYYALALARNGPMVENTLRLLQAPGSKLEKTISPGASSLEPRAVVLVAGGFHTRQITELLRRRNVAYAVITPTVEESIDAEQALYVQRLSGRYLTTEEILNSVHSPATLKYARALSKDRSTLAVGAVSLLGYHFLSAGLVQDVLLNNHHAFSAALPHFMSLLNQVPYVGAAHDIATKWMSSMPDVVAQYNPDVPAVGGMAMLLPFFGRKGLSRRASREIRQELNQVESERRSWRPQIAGEVRSSLSRPRLSSEGSPEDELQRAVDSFSEQVSLPSRVSRDPEAASGGVSDAENPDGDILPIDHPLVQALKLATGDSGLEIAWRLFLKKVGTRRVSLRATLETILENWMDTIQDIKLKREGKLEDGKPVSITIVFQSKVTVSFTRSRTDPAVWRLEHSERKTIGNPLRSQVVYRLGWLASWVPSSARIETSGDLGTEDQALDPWLFKSIPPDLLELFPPLPEIGPIKLRLEWREIERLLQDAQNPKEEKIWRYRGAIALMLGVIGLFTVSNPELLGVLAAGVFFRGLGLLAQLWNRVTKGRGYQGGYLVSRTGREEEFHSRLSTYMRVHDVTSNRLDLRWEETMPRAIDAFLLHGEPVDSIKEPITLLLYGEPPYHMPNLGPLRLVEVLEILHVNPHDQVFVRVGDIERNISDTEVPYVEVRAGNVVRVVKRDAAESDTGGADAIGLGTINVLSVPPSVEVGQSVTGVFTPVEGSRRGFNLPVERVVTAEEFLQESGLKELVESVPPENPARAIFDTALAWLTKDFTGALVIFDEDPAVPELQGFGQRQAIGVSMGVEKYPVARLHEILAAAVDAGVITRQALKAAVSSNEETQRWYHAHTAKPGRGTEGLEVHYGIRALTRQSFGDQDRELTAEIKALGRGARARNTLIKLIQKGSSGSSDSTVHLIAAKLHHLIGLNYEAIAEITGMTENTVRQRIFRGVNWLMEQMAKVGFKVARNEVAEILANHGYGEKYDTWLASVESWFHHPGDVPPELLVDPLQNARDKLQNARYKARLDSFSKKLGFRIKPNTRLKPVIERDAFLTTFLVIEVRDASDDRLMHRYAVGYIDAAGSVRRLSRPGDENPLRALFDHPSLGAGLYLLSQGYGPVDLEVVLSKKRVMRPAVPGLAGNQCQIGLHGVRMTVPSGYQKEWIRPDVSPEDMDQNNGIVIWRDPDTREEVEVITIQREGDKFVIDTEYSEGFVATSSDSRAVWNKDVQSFLSGSSDAVPPSRTVTVIRDLRGDRTGRYASLLGNHFFLSRYEEDEVVAEPAILPTGERVVRLWRPAADFSRDTPLRVLRLSDVKLDRPAASPKTPEFMAKASALRQSRERTGLPRHVVTRRAGLKFPSSVVSYEEGDAVIPEAVFRFVQELEIFHAHLQAKLEAAGLQTDNARLMATTLLRLNDLTLEALEEQGVLDRNQISSLASHEIDQFDASAFLARLGSRDIPEWVHSIKIEDRQRRAELLGRADRSRPGVSAAARPGAISEHIDEKPARGLKRISTMIMTLGAMMSLASLASLVSLMVTGAPLNSATGIGSVVVLLAGIVFLVVPPVVETQVLSRTNDAVRYRVQNALSQPAVEEVDDTTMQREAQKQLAGGRIFPVDGTLGNEDEFAARGIFLSETMSDVETNFNGTAMFRGVRFRKGLQWRPQGEGVDWNLIDESGTVLASVFYQRTSDIRYAAASLTRLSDAERERGIFAVLTDFPDLKAAVQVIWDDRLVQALSPQIDLHVDSDSGFIRDVTITLGGAASRGEDLTFRLFRQSPPYEIYGVDTVTSKERVSTGAHTLVTHDPGLHRAQVRRALGFVTPDLLSALEARDAAAGFHVIGMALHQMDLTRLPERDREVVRRIYFDANGRPKPKKVLIDIAQVFYDLKGEDRANLHSMSADEIVRLVESSHLERGVKRVHALFRTLGAFLAVLSIPPLAGLVIKGAPALSATGLGAGVVLLIGLVLLIAPPIGAVLKERGHLKDVETQVSVAARALDAAKKDRSLPDPAVDSAPTRGLVARLGSAAQRRIRDVLGRERTGLVGLARITAAA